ncbi:PilZ domain-containing protein [Sphingomonas sp. ID0503]|uniref:PilZ domain-containing protein n=1 Tax=Sphingomonas sp. ID0503 TaxID=3399691 RepID=UPI003AFA4566
MSELVNDNDDDDAFAVLRKRGARDSMFLMATLRRDANGETLSVRVRNISNGGVLVECPNPFAREERVALELRGIGWVGGKVAWSAPGKFGVAFDIDIDPKLTRKPLATGGPRAAPMGPTVVNIRRPGLRFD